MNKIFNAKYIEWEASLFGACFIAFGLGALFSNYFQPFILWGLILLGIVIHSWGMYMIHIRNK